ncbi:hypothetical protein [Shewanella xiamenensis]|uniref:hypothetical protein n=1 Tax=Shewanella xiamenensis TaxID=332186 RepID=UPI0024A6C64D|nr:hypothetical protein [Shewanella xiamenensis]
MEIITKNGIDELNRKEFKQEYEKRGWNPDSLSERWGCSKTRIHQIASEVEKNHKKTQAYIDMLHGLPYLQKS